MTSLFQTIRSAITGGGLEIAPYNVIRSGEVGPYTALLNMLFMYHLKKKLSVKKCVFSKTFSSENGYALC